jgi:UDP-glucose 6-dehydrogenase
MEFKIYGMGWVGKAMLDLFPNAHVHDPELGHIYKEKCDVGFVCVPTPLKKGKLDTSIVEEVVKSSEEDLLIIRSTVNPGDCLKWDKAYSKNLVFMPEYLGETVAHPLLDETKRNFLIMGGHPKNRRKAIDLFMTVFNADTKIRQMTNYEAEIVKLSENRAIMFKVLQCHELYLACQKHGVDYYTIREAVYGDDPRFDLWWTAIYKELGVNSKCLPKDVYAWSSWAGTELTQHLLEYNECLVSQSLPKTSGSSIPLSETY